MISTVPLSVSADENDDIPANAAGTGYHNSLVAALTQADLVTTLKGTGPFTVFAPTDEAFTAAGIDLSTFDTDEENATLADILTYHVVSGTVLSTDLTDGMDAAALNTDSLTFTVNTAGVMVNDAKVVTADVESSNGVIHIIDKVLMPPVDVFVSDGSMTSPYYQFYSDAAGTNEIVDIDTSKNYKFQRLNNPSTHPFYISDSGYEAASTTDIMIVGDGSSTTGISDGESFTLFFKDGFSDDDTLSYYCTVHSSMVADFSLITPVTLEDIPTIATGTGYHTALVAALAQADLVATLQGTGPFTVFAPTDEAFTAAGIDLSTFDTVEENATLVDILTYHVVSGTVLSTDLTDGMTAAAVNTDSLTFTVNTAGVMVNDANVVTADVLALNGVVHIIDKVLMPPADPVVEELATCDYTVGIGLSGMAFNPSVLEINVGQTVCWQWTDATMAHNVKEVDGEKSKVFVDGGITSGTSQTTVDFRYTFTEDSSTFYYVCEPHILAEMYGKVVVGDGGVVVVDNGDVKTDDDKSDSNTPGFVSVTAVIALMGALLFARNKNE
tara:strand:+ start:6192 stop:7856 length:1665 start_codon:yes stop_codon:yes gene_type:complete